MINLDFEVNRLKDTLRIKGFSQQDVDNISDMAQREINIAVDEVVNNAVSQTKEMGIMLGLESFAKQVRAIRSGNSYEIVTDSGDVDFSTPAFPMLPNLLKNAKKAKDGSLYKRIPIKSKSKNVVTNIFDVRSRSAKEQLKVLQERRMSNDQRRNPEQVDNQINTVNMSKSIDNTDFKTASSKQNSNTQWVLPPKRLDMHDMLNDMNNQMENTIQRTVLEIIRKYEDAIHKY